MDKVFVLLSGGVDSTTCLAMARNDFPDAEIECVTVNYGQRHIKEAECAKWQAAQFEADYMMINAKGLMTGMLVDKGPGENNEDIPQVDYADLPEGISPTYVSYRNGLMLSILAARAQAWVMERQKAIDNIPDEELMLYTKEELKPNAYIYIGTHADDGARDAYPDCTAEFIGNQASAIYIGTYFRVRLRAPIVHMEKSEVVAKGSRLGVDYSRTWSCYAGGDLHCGVCPTCRQRKDAFIAADILDPTEYAA